MQKPLIPNKVIYFGCGGIVLLAAILYIAYLAYVRSIYTRTLDEIRENQARKARNGEY